MSLRISAVTALTVLSCFAGTAALAQGNTAAAQSELKAPPKVTGARLQALDKLVARVHEVEAPLNQETAFGTLKIVVRQCTVSPSEAPPEAAAFLEITEQRPGEEASKVFSGWMFASSPALSALEHPVYDVWVVGCDTTASAEPVKTR